MFFFLTIENSHLLSNLHLSSVVFPCEFVEKFSYRQPLLSSSSGSRHLREAIRTPAPLPLPLPHHHHLQWSQPALSVSRLNYPPAATGQTRQPSPGRWGTPVSNSGNPDGLRRRRWTDPTFLHSPCTHLLLHPTAPPYSSLKESTPSAL